MTDRRPARGLFGRRVSLRRRFMLLFAGVAVLAILLAATAWLSELRTSVQRTERQKLESELGILTEALVPALVQSQYGAIYASLNRLDDAHARWVKLVLHLPDGRQIYPLAPVPEPSGQHLVRDRRIIRHGPREIARIEIVSDYEPAYLAALRQFRTVFGFMATACIVMMACTLVGVDRMVVQPIALLASAARRLSRGDYEAELPRMSRDEIGALTYGFARMRERIHLNEDRLIAARDEARRNAEVKTRFLATMSHEIRTPLNGIIPIAELLLESDLAPRQRDLVTTIVDSGQALRSVIDDILDIAKLDEGKVTIRRRGFDLARMMGSLRAMFAVTAGQRGLSLELVIDPMLKGRVVGDKDRLRQVLMNLVGNALKFTEFGGVRIEVRPAGPPMVQFSVSDTGIGISEPDRAKVFRRFEQVDNRSNREFQGSGLGLPICKALVEAMGGSIRVDSEVGKGSTFVFDLPMPPGDDEGRAIVPRPGTSEPSEPSESPAMRVLVVDDNRVNRKIASAVLGKLGHLAALSADAADALERMQTEFFDAVLMDVHMPGMDGLEATRRIRAMEGAPGDTWVIGFSASAFDDDVARCRAAGMNGFLAKPLARDALMAELRRAAQGLGVPPPPSPSPGSRSASAAARGS